MAIIVGDLIARLNLDGSGYQKGVAEINRQTRLVQSQFDLASARLGNFGTGLDGLRLKSQTLSAQLSVQSGRVQLLEEAHRRSVEAVGADARASQELQIRLNQARAEQQRMENDLRDTNGRIDEQSSSWYRLSQSMNAIGDQMQKVGKKMTEVGKTMSLAVTAPIVAFGTLAVKSAIEFESAFAGVRKTVDGTEAELASLRAGILKMSREIPAAATEIAKVAEAAGQLGIEKESILGFTRTMVDLGVATNLSSDEAATALARLANITQMPQSEFNKLGSTIVALGNNLATTEAEIVAMGLRIAGAGSQIGLTEAQILSFAGALSSVGIEAEAGGSSISRVMIDIGQAVATGGDGLNNFAKVAGMSAGDFKQAFETDAANALVTFIEGLGRISEAGANVFGVLEDLGLSEIRVRDALLRASGAGDLFRESLELGSKAWEENNALNKEAGERYKTTESQLKILRNRIDDMMGTIGDALIPILLDVVKALDPVINKLASMADAFYAMDASSKKTILAIVGMVAAIGPLLVVTGVVVSSIGSVISALGVVSGSIAAAGGIAAAFSKVMALAVAPIKAVGAALTFLVTNPIGLAITAISLLVVGLVALNRHMQKDSIPAVESFGNEAQNAAQKATGSFKKFRTESKQELDKAAGTTKAAGEQIGKDFSLGVSKGTKKAKDAAVADMKEMVDRMKEEVDRSTKSLDKLGDAISQALKKRYDEQEKLAISAKEAEIKEAEKTSEAKIKLQEQQQKAVEKSAEEELKTQKKLTDNKIKELDKEYAAKLKSLDIETSGQVKAIQDQIDAIDKQTDAEDKAREQQEHNDKLTELNKQLAAAETAEERIKIQAEINKEIAAYNRAQLLETRKTAKEQLKSQIDVIKEAAADKKEALKQELSDKKDHEKDLLEALVERLNDEKEKTKTHYSDLKESEQEKLKSVKETLGEEKDAIKEHYAELTTKEALLAESRLQIIEQNNDEIIQLLSEYNPKWQDAGQSFAESLAEGLASEKQTIEDAVKGVIDIAPAIHAQTQELETLQSKLKELEKAAKAAGEAGGAGAAGSNISTGDTSLPIVPGAPSPNVKKVVEATQEMRLESFKAFQGLRNDAEKELKTLQWSGSKVTEETAAAIADNFFAMGSTILDNLEASNTDQLKSMKNFFKNSSALTEEEELAALEKIKNSQLESAKEVEVGQKRVAEILSKALDDKRILTKDEYAEINKIQADMNKEAERALGAHEI
ncbi:Chromosome partition protein Smc [compost metagenome]